MTKRDFNLIAKGIREAYIGERRETARKLMAESLGDVWVKSNPRFGRERFVRACMGNNS